LPRLGLAAPLCASRRFKADDVVEALGLRMVSGELAAGELLPKQASLSHIRNFSTAPAA
jgi:DNA-binding FadR family transcriptional regulator